MRLDKIHLINFFVYKIIPRRDGLWSSEGILFYQFCSTSIISKSVIEHHLLPAPVHCERKHSIPQLRNLSYIGKRRFRKRRKEAKRRIISGRCRLDLSSTTELSTICQMSDEGIKIFMCSPWKTKVD